MERNIKLYEYGVSPLQQVRQNDVLEGDLYITEEGHLVEAIDTEDSLVLELIKNSPLVEGEYMSGLTDKQLKLFWILIGK